MIVPNFLKQIFSDHKLSMSQKMVALMAFMPNPPEPKTESLHSLGVEIEKLIKRNKIQFGKFDENFILDITKK